ncbi:TRAP transporter substrate-binding protein [Pusillimonas sp. ANT_WB101]|uniref:TRAP transporter substrate-binding protein n=1 Tax=Pusillimonas sp. ANT_WB101 TaxID=2597356 RepID=UPI0011ED36AF|nr:TRAP transporter substrate-binding protein [Pusillimonas sp. ANT_WB101]KAA0892633.1 TRAP transporter substrate-binding protein [Pusillimonas sp. ANT_WB101]
MRFSKLLLTSAMTLAVFTMAPGAQAAKRVHVSYNVAEGSSWDKGAKVFQKLVEERSNGDFKVSLHPNAAMAGGNDRVEMEMAQGGGIQFLIKSTTWMTGLDPKFQALGLPWLFPDHETANKVLDGPAGDALMKTLENRDLVGLAWGVNGFRQVTNSRLPITQPADFKNLKIRVPGIPLYLAIFKELGANPTTMSFSEVFTALQTGTVDGQENPMSLISSSRFYDVQKYMTIWNYSYDAIVFATGASFWKGLSPEDQKMFKDAAHEAMDAERKIVEEEDKILPAELEKAGMTVTNLTPEQLAVFQKTLQPVYAEYKEKLGADFVELFENGVKQAKN